MTSTVPLITSDCGPHREVNKADGTAMKRDENIRETTQGCACSPEQQHKLSNSL